MTRQYMKHPSRVLQWFEQVRSLTEDLVAIRTVSPDVEGENRCADRICALLQDGRDLKAELWSTGDGRYNVACLLRGTKDGKSWANTVILLGHYDTVGEEEYVRVDPNKSGQIAFEPARLRDALLRFLNDKGDLSQSESDVQRDLEQTWKADGQEQPAWMFGRGCFDMKGGVAALIAVMRRLSQERTNLSGNILFVACPDEENESGGILSAIYQLNHLRSKHHLQYLGIINADYTAPRSDDQFERYIYTGVVGKLLPSFYILGDTTHVGEPFRGVDAGQIAAELVSKLNLNAEFSDIWSGTSDMQKEVAVPPMTLKVRDLKRGYNVQTAEAAFVYANWLTYQKSPHQALRDMKRVAEQALSAVENRRQSEYAAFTARGGQEPTPKQHETVVLDYAELCEKVRAARGWRKASSNLNEDPFVVWLNNLACDFRVQTGQHQPDKRTLDARLASATDNRELGRLLIDHMVKEAQIKGPAIVVFFSPPYYPHIRPQENEITKALANVLKQQDSGENLSLGHLLEATQTSGSEGQQLHLRGFYPYISDLSYVRLEIGPTELQALTHNMPLFGRGYWLDFQAMRELDCAVVNIGPWGKDAHGLYERIHMPYSFEVVPQIIYETVVGVLTAQWGSIPTIDPLTMGLR